MIEQFIFLAGGFLLGSRVGKKDITTIVSLTAAFIVVPSLMSLVGLGGLPVGSMLLSTATQIFIGGIIIRKII